ncbi:MAG: CPBP family intramembrane metalloprotease [Clostridiales bacterium]|nr:CPBP family intramembrane metalloprotease [Clostridiales bacterium]
MMKRDTVKPEAAKATPGAKIKRMFTRPDGRLRTGWLLLGTLILYRAASLLVRLLLNGAFARLFSAWNVNAGNVHRAPGWAQTVYAWHGSFVTVVVCLVTAFAALCLRKLWIGTAKIRASFREGFVPALVGAGIAVVSAIIFVIADSMRMEWPLSKPHISWGLFVMLPVTLLTTACEELFTKCVVFDGIAARLKKSWAFMLSAFVFFLFNGGYAGTVTSGVNVLLMGFVCCALYDVRGLWAASLFRGMWSYASVFLAGFGTSGAAQSVYALYGVSENWLTGGDGGMIYGLWMTVILAGMLAWLKRGIFEKLKKRIVRK